MEYLLNEILTSAGIQTLIGMAAIILATVLASTVLRSVVFSIIGKLTSRTGTTLDDRLLDATRSYRALLVSIFGLSILFNFIEARFTDYVSEDFVRVIDALIYGIVVATSQRPKQGHQAGRPTCQFEKPLHALPHLA